MRYDMYDNPKYQELPPNARYLMMYLLNRQGNNDSTWVSAGTMSRDMGIARATVFRMLRLLSNRGWIERWQTDGQTHTRVSQGDGGLSVIPTPSHDETPLVSQCDTPRLTVRPKVKEKIKKNIKEKIYTSEFEEWWSAYPRKVGKAAAAKAYSVAAEKTDHATLIATIGNIDASEAKFIPHPTTWLNQERWLDEPPVEETSVYDDIKQAIRRSQLQPESNDTGRLANGHLAIVGNTTPPENERTTDRKDQGISRGSEQISTGATPRPLHIPIKRMPGVAGRKP